MVELSTNTIHGSRIYDREISQEIYLGRQNEVKNQDKIACGNDTTGYDWDQLQGTF